MQCNAMDTSIYIQLNENWCCSLPFLPACFFSCWICVFHLEFRKKNRKVKFITLGKFIIIYFFFSIFSNHIKVQKKSLQSFSHATRNGRRCKNVVITFSCTIHIHIHTRTFWEEIHILFIRKYSQSASHPNDGLVSIALTLYVFVSPNIDYKCDLAVVVFQQNLNLLYYYMTHLQLLCNKMKRRRNTTTTTAATATTCIHAVHINPSQTFPWVKITNKSESENEWTLPWMWDIDVGWLLEDFMLIKYLR